MASIKSLAKAAKLASYANALAPHIVVLNLIEETAKKAYDAGVRLTTEGIFSDADTAVYRDAALAIVSQRISYASLLKALAIHDTKVMSDTGVDFGQFNQDFSLLTNHVPLATEINRLTGTLKLEAALVNGIHGYLVRTGYNR